MSSVFRPNASVESRSSSDPAPLRPADSNGNTCLDRHCMGVLRSTSYLDYCRFRGQRVGQHSGVTKGWRKTTVLPAGARGPGRRSAPLVHHLKQALPDARQLSTSHPWGARLLWRHHRSNAG
jgi:hypothetical protein